MTNAVGSSLPNEMQADMPDVNGAFHELGFDPKAEGCGTFVVASDIHFSVHTNYFAQTVDDWNAMDPKPAMAILLGDNVSMNNHFGHNPGSPEDAVRIERCFQDFKDALAKLDPDIPVQMLIGNHDENPSEDNAATFRSHFPEMKPYEAFDLLGVSFFKWNGGHDCSFDARQSEWIRTSMANLPTNRAVVILVHQPGELAYDRGTKAMAREILANHTGEAWLLCGHKHGDDGCRYTLPGGGELAFQIHRMNKHGYWVYGVRDGSIVARVLVTEKRKCIPQKPREAMPDRGPLPVILDDRDDVVWKIWVGDADEKADYRLSIGKSQNAGTWFAYTDELTYRFPKAKVAPEATRFAVVGDRIERKIGNPAKEELPKCTYSFSLDGETWTDVPTPTEERGVYVCPIPESMIEADLLFFRLKSFRWSGGMVGGFLFLQ
ncbi:MAG: metallophosphoesterase family protein [Kiritimatiellia bacterium]